MVLGGLEALARSLAMDPQKKKLAALEALVQAADLIKFAILPELGAASVGYDPRLAAASRKVLAALATASLAARRLGGAA